MVKMRALREPMVGANRYVSPYTSHFRAGDLKFKKGMGRVSRECYVSA